MYGLIAAAPVETVATDPQPLVSSSNPFLLMAEKESAEETEECNEVENVLFQVFSSFSYLFLGFNFYYFCSRQRTSKSSPQKTMIK